MFAVLSLVIGVCDDFTAYLCSSMSVDLTTCK